MRTLSLFIFLATSTLFCQNNTEVFVFDIIKSNKKYHLKNIKNISNNKGYDSQPFFYDNDNVIFSSTRKNNTDILFYNLKINRKRFISNTENGGEYSPQRIPKSNYISAVRLDNDGLQRFYKYNFNTGKNTKIIKDLKIAYPTWFNKNTIVASTIVNDSLHLLVCNLKNKTHSTVAKNVGRSVHKIPNTNLVSFISKKNKDNWLLKSLNIKTQEIKTLISVKNSNDVAWLNSSTLLIAKGNSIYKINLKKDKKPSLLYCFSNKNINNVSRIAVNNNATKIAIVAEITAKK